MIEIFVTITVLLSVMGFLLLSHERPVAGAISLLFAVIMSIIASSIDRQKTFGNTPTALDVYRDKTTLEITYRDSVAVDSVVVYKKFDYENWN